MRRSRFLIPLLLVALGWNAAFVLAAAYPNVFLPIIRSAPPATTCALTSTLLLDRDAGSISAIRTTDGRYLVAAQLRDDNSRLHVMQHIGTTLQEVAIIPAASVMLTDTISPQFTPPGPKQGPGALVEDPAGPDRLYFTQRVPDETPNEGPYAIYCQSFGS